MEETVVTPTEDPRIAALTRELDESRQSEKYWAGLARAGSASAAEPEPEPTEEESNAEFYDEVPAGLPDDTPEKMIDDFAAEGAKALSKRGFVTTAQAHKLAVDAAVRVTNALIGRERSKMTSDTQIMGEFPELKDQNSELFKETAKRYQRAVAMDPAAKKTPAALYLAAEGARDALRARRGDPDTEDESDRRRRVDAQDGRARGRGQGEEPDDMLGANAREVIKAMGLTEKEFQDARKETAGMRPLRR